MPEISKNNNSASGSELSLFVRSRTTTLFQGNVNSITSVNQTGIFDILPLHANFITLIKDYIIINKGRKDEKKIDIKTAVLSVIEGKVDVYVEI